MMSKKAGAVISILLSLLVSFTNTRVSRPLPSVIELRLLQLASER